VVTSNRRSAHQGGRLPPLAIIFCYYSADGCFQRGPLMVDDEDIAGLCRFPANVLKLRAIILRLVE
jgi:hypothetical protein